MNGNDKLKQIIGNAKNILVVTSESINVDLLSSQLVFAQILSSIGKKRVDVLADTRFTNSFHQIVDKFSSLSIKDRILPHLTVISISNSPDDLDGIEWKKEKD
ncbi:hypothetical protein KC660_01165, partial [Candidatus Dojkabacteria bacterium]|nr:hypothetical protein [Candidatus Dojkabacteria bacterium]